MRKNLLSSDTLLPVLHATSLSFSRLFAAKCAKGELSEAQSLVYGNVEECLKEGVAAARKETSVHRIYMAFAKGCLSMAYTEEAAVLGFLAHECALSFQGKQTLTGKDWGDGFKRGFLAAKEIYDGPILFAEESILQEAFRRKIDDLDGLIALFSLSGKVRRGSGVFYDFLKASAMGFASPLPPKESAPFGEMSLSRLSSGGYRLTFLLQCLHSKNKPFDEGEFTLFLKRHCRDFHLEVNGDKIALDAHVDASAPIVIKSQEYGEFVTFSLKNAYVTSFDARPSYRRSRNAPKKDVALLSLAPNRKCGELFIALGASMVIDTASCPYLRLGDLLLGMRKCEAGNVLFLPTSEREYLLGRIASRLAYGQNVIALPCPSLQQAYFGLSNALFEEEGLDALIESISSGIDAIVPLTCPKGQLLSFLESYPSLEESELAFIMAGPGDEGEIARAKERLEERNPYLEIGSLDLDCPMYLIGVAA